MDWLLTATKLIRCWSLAVSDWVNSRSSGVGGTAKVPKNEAVKICAMVKPR